MQDLIRGTAGGDAVGPELRHNIGGLYAMLRYWRTHVLFSVTLSSYNLPRSTSPELVSRLETHLAASSTSSRLFSPSRNRTTRDIRTTATDASMATRQVSCQKHIYNPNKSTAKSYCVKLPRMRTRHCVSCCPVLQITISTLGTMHRHGLLATETRH